MRPRGISQHRAGSEHARREGAVAPAGNPGWALMQRSFGFDLLACPRCAGRLRLIALIHQPAVVQRILRHLGVPDAPPVCLPSRDPPRRDHEVPIDPGWSD